MISIVESLFRCGFEYEVIDEVKQSQSMETQSIQKVEQINQKSDEKVEKKVFSGLSKEYFVEKEKTKHEVMRVQEELNHFVSNYEENAEITKSEELKIRQTKEKAINLEPSNAEFIISEACVLIETKYNSLIDFMEIRNSKLKVDEQKDYKNTLMSILEDSQKEKVNNYNEAAKKIMVIVEHYLFEKERERKSKLECHSIQTDPEPILPPVTSKADKEKFRLKEEEIKALKQELKNEKGRIQSLERLLKQKTEEYEKEIMKQQVTVKKLEQRVSIASKFSHRESQFTMDFVNSSQSIIKEEQSQKSEKSIRISKESSEKMISRKSYDRQVYDRRVSKVRQSREKLTMIPNFDHRRSSRFQSLKEKIKIVNLEMSSKIFEVTMHPSCLLSCTDAEMGAIAKCNASIQTEFRYREGLKQKTKAEKSVTFKTELRFNELYSIQIEPIIRDPGLREISNYLNESRGFSTLLKKKKGNPHWGQTRKYPRQSCDDVQEDFFVPRRSYSKVEMSSKENKQTLVDFENLCIGLTPEQAAEKDRREIDSMKEMRTKVKTKIPEMSAVTFGKVDIDMLFMDTEKAVDFEFLSYNMGSQKSRFESFEILKSQQYMLFAKSSPEKLDELQNFHSHHRQIKSNRRHSTSTPSSQNELVIQTLYRHLNIVKYSSHEKYEKIRNFLRFPHSAIFKNNEQKWLLLSKQENEMGINELRKIFSRIERVHDRCEKGPMKVCQHLIDWMQKIGLCFGEEKVL